MCGSDQSSASSPQPPRAKDLCVQATVAHLQSSHCHPFKTLLTLCLLSLSSWKQPLARPSGSEKAKLPLLWAGCDERGTVGRWTGKRYEALETQLWEMWQRSSERRSSTNGHRGGQKPMLEVSARQTRAKRTFGPHECSRAQQNSR